MALTTSFNVIDYCGNVDLGMVAIIRGIRFNCAIMAQV